MEIGIPSGILSPIQPRCCSFHFDSSSTTQLLVQPANGSNSFACPLCQLSRCRNFYTISVSAIFLQKNCTYTIQGKRAFIKDMAQYLFEPEGRPTSIASSFGGASEPGNPTVLPEDVLRTFHFTFLIRHPRRSVPSYWRCTVPPRRDTTGWLYYDPAEAGYLELVKLFDFLMDRGIITKDNVTVVDADDILDNPEGIIRQYCERTDIPFSPDMLQWSEDDDKHAKILFEKWNGWHDDALQTSCLHARTHRQVSRTPTWIKDIACSLIWYQKSVTEETENEEWAEKYGADAQKAIRKTVDENIPHYEYLKQFRIKA